jgi:hypothetical protein
MKGWDVFQTWGMTSCRRWGEVLDGGRSCIGRINCMGWQGLMNRIKMVIPSIQSISLPSTGKKQAGMTRKV